MTSHLNIAKAETGIVATRFVFLVTLVTSLTVVSCDVFNMADEHVTAKSVDHNEDVHLVAASCSPFPPPLPQPPLPLLHHESTSSALEAPSAASAALIEYHRSTAPRRKRSPTVEKSSFRSIPLPSSDSSYPLESSGRSVAESGFRWTGTDVDGRSAHDGPLKVAAALQFQQQRQLLASSDVDVCWNFTVGDEQRHELYSPRMTHPPQHHSGPHAIHQTIAPTSRHQPLLQQPYPGTTTAQRRTHYPNKADCVRLLSAPANHRIRLEFRDEFHIEESENCAYDYLEILDGPFGYSTPIGRYCGTRDPPLVESSGRYLWLRFHSDDSIEYEGFRIVYEFFPSSEETEIPSAISELRANPCIFDIEFTDKDETLGLMDGSISSNNIPVRYIDLANRTAGHVDCTWIFHTPPTSKVYFHWSQYKMSTPQICSDSFIDYYEQGTSLADRRHRYCEATPSRGDRRTTSSIAYFRLYADSVDRVPQFTIVYTLTSPGPCDTSSQFDCGDRWCIARSLVCNGQINCNRSRDEVNCSSGINPRAQLDVPETVRHHTIIVGVVFGIMLTTAILAVCASFYQGRRERRHQRKMALCTTEAAATFDMTELPPGGNNGGLRRSSKPKTDFGENADRTAQNHRSGNNDVSKILPTTTASMNGINRTCLTSSLPLSYSCSGDVTTVSRETRSLVTAEGQHVNHRPTLNHMTSSIATLQAFQPLNSSQHEPMSVAGTVSGGTISAVATIEKRPPSPRSSSLLRWKNNGHRGHADNTTSLRQDPEDVRNEPHADNITSSMNGVQHPISTVASSATGGDVISQGVRTGGQLSSSHAAVRSAIFCDDESSAVVGRRTVVNSGWAATVKPLPSNGRSTDVHNLHTNHIAFGANANRPQAPDTSISTAVVSETHPTRPISLPVDFADMTTANRRRSVPPPPPEVPRATHGKDVTEDGGHVLSTSSSHQQGVRSNRSANSLRTELPSDSILPYNKRPYKGTHSIVF